jgi:hypothetical protein
MKKHIIVLILLGITYSLYSVNPIAIQLKVKNNSLLNLNSLVKVNGIISTSDTFINRIFIKYKVVSMERSFPAVANINHPNVPELLKIYTIKSDTDLMVLKQVLTNTASTYFERINEIYQPNETAGAFYPNDTWDLANSYLWRFSLIKANEAWAITKGSENVKIGVVECCSGFEETHEDLVDKISYVWSGSGWTKSHGTIVAGLAGGATNNNKGISSVGFNCKLVLTGPGSYSSMVDVYNNGASVINNSWISCYNDPNNQLLINTLTDLGVVIVGTSGNGNVGASCGNGHGYGYPGSYDNVICVSGVNFEDKFNPKWECNNPAAASVYFSHNDKVDIVAPGFCTASTHTSNSYSFNYGGTSFAAPMVCGAIGLLKSINPCLKTPQVETILKISGDDVSAIGNNASYYASPSQVPKRLNVYKAVLEAIKTVSIFFKNQTLTSTNNYQASYGIYAGSHPDFPTLTGATTIATNANITFKATQEIYLGPDFEVQSGATFEAKPEIIACQ